MAKKIKWDEEAPAARSARRVLPRVAAEYFAEARVVAGGKGTAAALHRLRLRTKRLRYTLELFRPCYGPGLDKHLSALRRVQQLLGAINDCAAAGRMIDGMLLPRSPQRLRLRRFLDARARASLAEFRRYWTEEVDAPGRERVWRSYLGRARQAR